MKILLRLVLAILLVLVLFVAAVIANNVFFDEELDPKAAVIGEPVVQRVAEDQNGYLALIAFGASDGANGSAYARAWLGEVRAAAKENRAVSPIVVKRATRPELCEAARVSCLAAVKENQSSVVARLDAYKQDLERYERLLAFRAYEEVLDYPVNWDSPLPAYQNVMGAQRAYLLRAALAVQAGNIEEAVAAVERDIAFQRVMLAGARTILGKIIAANLYLRDLAFVTDLLQSRVAELKPFMPRLTEMLKPIDPAALRLDAALAMDFLHAKQVLKNRAAGDQIALSILEYTEDKSRPLQASVFHRIGARYFYKPNATINEGFRRYLRDAELSRRPPALLARPEPPPPPASDTFLDHIMDILHPVLAPVVYTASGLWDIIDNPVGNDYFRHFAFSSEDYALRLHDLDASNRLLALGAEILAADIAVEGIGDFVAKSDARFHDPYTGKPMAWDAGRRQLSFKPSNELVRRKRFNMDQGRMILRV